MSFSSTGGRSLAWVLAAVVALVGCQFKGEAGQPGAGAVAEGVWRPRPVALRIYPSTRFVREGGETLLEARVEFFDEMGDPTKAAGEVRLDLFASDESGGSLGQRLYRWEVELLTLEDQRQHFDAITRTYLFRLRLDNAEPSRRPTVLRATLTPAEGTQRLEAQAGVGGEFRISDF